MGPGSRAGRLTRAAPNQALEPTPTAFARTSLRLLVQLTAGVRLHSYGNSWCEAFEETIMWYSAVRSIVTLILTLLAAKAQPPAKVARIGVL
jgi:hypothetical protein